MDPNEKPSKTFYHKDQEISLQAAKRSLRTNRKAYMHRRTDFADDVIDIIDDGKIIERHIAKKQQQVVAIIVRRPVPVEEMALYQ